MNDPNSNLPPAFGEVDFDAEHGLFYIDTARGRTCRLTVVGRTERGYPRRELASLPGPLWKQVATAVQNELVRSMDEEEHGKNVPKLKTGENALSPLIVRELAVLIWALMEDAEGTHTDALLAGWRQLAREERWWLYARASSPAQQLGQGWRRALFFALTDPADTRTAPRLMDLVEGTSGSKKNSGAKPIGSVGTPKKKATKKKPQPQKKKSVKKSAARKTVKKSPTTKKAAKKKAAKKTSKKKAVSKSSKPKTSRVSSKGKSSPKRKKAAPKRKKTATTTAHQ